MSELEPCRTCPWRRENPAGGELIPRFEQAMMDGLTNTVGEEDAFRPIMACHYSGEDAFACRGYVAQEGWRNLSVRILASDGTIDVSRIMEACEKIDLYPDFTTMLRAYQEANRPDGP